MSGSWQQIATSESIQEGGHNDALPDWVQVQINFIDQDSPFDRSHRSICQVWIENYRFEGDIADHGQDIALTMAQILIGNSLPARAKLDFKTLTRRRVCYVHAFIGTGGDSLTPSSQ